MDSSIEELRYKVLTEARKSLEANRETFISLWAMQQWSENPKIDFSQYTMCYQASWHSQDGVERFWMEKKS